MSTLRHGHPARLWNPGDGKEIKKLGDHTSSVYGLAFTSDGQTLASCGNDALSRSAGRIGIGVAAHRIISRGECGLFA